MYSFCGFVGACAVMYHEEKWQKKKSLELLGDKVPGTPTTLFCQQKIKKRICETHGSSQQGE